MAVGGGGVRGGEGGESRYKFLWIMSSSSFIHIAGKLQPLTFAKFGPSGPPLESIYCICTYSIWLKSFKGVCKFEILASDPPDFHLFQNWPI